MKCPKCGSEYEHDNRLVYCPLCGVSKEQLEEEHQQRLDNVLKHFEKAHNNNYNYELNNDFGINYSNKLFMLVSCSEICKEYNFLDISLNTVESLLKDLGVMK